MDFAEEINALSVRVGKMIEHVETEEATKNALIMPFISALGYNIFDPTEVMPEYNADVGTKRGEKVDYALMKDGKPIILFECKSVNSDLNAEHASQLYRYFSVTPARVGILTNGITYKFYSDLEEKNKMDLRPFLEFDILNVKDQAIEALKMFRKSDFKLDEITEAASEMKYMKEIKRILGDELNKPSDEFVRFFAHQVYPGRITKTVHDRFRSITHKAFLHFLNEKINERLQSAIEKGKETEEEIKEKFSTKEDEIITTDEEKEGYYIVRAILQDLVPVERIALRDYKHCCNVLFDGKVTQAIVRFYFNKKQKYIGLVEDDKKENRVPIQKLSDIYKYKDRIRKTLLIYDKNITIPETSGV